MPNPTLHVAIVGGGIAGLSLARALAPEVPVTLFEAGAVHERGASSLPAALLNPHRGRTARAHDHDRAGLAAFWRRDAELRADGHDTGSMRTGVLRIASTERQAALWRDAVDEGDHVSRLEPAEVPPEYHAPFGAIVVEDGGWVRPNRLLDSLAAAARAAGGRILEGVRILDLAPTGDEWTLSSDDDRWRATHVVLCTGADPVPGPHRPDVPLERVAGDVVSLATTHPAMPIPVAGAVYGASRDATAFVGGNHRAPDADDPSAADALRSSMAWFVPSLRDARIAGVWTGVRVKRPGNRPYSEQIAGRLWFHGAMAGRGFLCSATGAERLAGRILATP